jgi:hypothetical protein
VAGVYDRGTGDDVLERTPERGGERPGCRDTGDAAADLGGWLVDDGEEGSAPYRIPDAVVLGAEERLVLYSYKTGLVFEDSGDEVRLIEPQGRVVDRVVLGQLLPDTSYGRDAEGAWTILLLPSPGQANVT